MSKEINPNKVLFDQLLEDAYRAGLYTVALDIHTILCEFSELIKFSNS
jgi:hypothetical protein